MGTFHKNGGYSADLDMFVDIILPGYDTPERVNVWSMCKDEISFKSNFLLDSNCNAHLCISVDGKPRWRKIHLKSGAYSKGEYYQYFEPV